MASSVGDTIVTVLSTSKLASKSRSSETSESSSKVNCEGGVEALSFGFLLYFAFFGIIELAHDFTFLGVLLDFRDLILVLCSPDSSSSTMGEGRGDSMGTVRAGSEALDRVGTEGSPRRGSDLKKLRRLAGRAVVLGVVTAVGEIAEEGRLRLVPSSSECLRLPKIAPAVLGRDSSSTVLSVGRPFLNVCGLAVPALTTDDKLFVAE
jgi:hypothetical protein